MSVSEEGFDAAVVGAGFGGLAAALRLVESGARVVLFEALNYPGGCAGSFERGGLRYDAGATLLTGLGEDGYFGRWLRRLGVELEEHFPDPVIELRAPGLTLPIGSDRRGLERALAVLPGAPRERLATFFDHQRRVADALWSVLDEPELLPPFDLRSLARHAGRFRRYAPLLPDVGRPLLAVLERNRLADFAPLRLAADAIGQITVQCDAARAEAPIALATLDYTSRARGTGHLTGGVGRLAWGLIEGLRRLGGEVRLATRVRGLAREGRRWRVDTRRGPVRADAVFANLLPQALERVLDPELARPRRLERLARELEDGWGACLLFLALRADGGTAGAAPHLQLIADPARPLTEGNHAFCSIGQDVQAHPELGRVVTATVSTHVALSRLEGLTEEERAAYLKRVLERLRATLAARAPEVAERIVALMTATPRTFERFTGRPGGLVGGIPRVAGWRPYLRLANRPLLGGGGGSRGVGSLTLVGDTVFPGQGTLAAALGGERAARLLLDGGAVQTRSAAKAAAGSPVRLV